MHLTLEIIWICQCDDHLEKAPGPARGSPHIRVEVDHILDEAAGTGSRLGGAGDDALSNIRHHAGGLSSDKVRSEGENGENREA